MPQDRDDLPSAVGTPAPTAADFDEAFSAAAASPGIRRVWELAAPDLPPQVEPFSFVSVGMLRKVAEALGLSPGQHARRSGMRPRRSRAVARAGGGCFAGGGGLLGRRDRSGRASGGDVRPGGRARFVVGDLIHTGLPSASADAAVSIDAFHFAADTAAAAGEARRVLRPGRRLVLTNWQPQVPDDQRLPSRMRTDLAAATARRRLCRHRGGGPARMARSVDPRLPDCPRLRRSRSRRPARRSPRRSPAATPRGEPRPPGRRHRDGAADAGELRAGGAALAVQLESAVRTIPAGSPASPEDTGSPARPADTCPAESLLKKWISL